MDTIVRMRAFVEIVDAGGYSAAARKMGRSKALLSKYVRELEDGLGALLINRTTRQFSLTEAGALYLDSAIDLLSRLESMEESVRDSAKGLKGRLRITAPSAVSSRSFGEPFAKFACENPDLLVEVDLSDKIVDLVEDGFDVALRIGTLDSSSLIAKRLAPFKGVLVGTPEFLKNYPPINTPSDLANVPVVLDTNLRKKNNWQFVESNGGEITQTVTSIMEINSPSSCKLAALMGLGVTLIPEFTMRDEINEGKLVSLLDDYLPNSAGYYVVYANRRHVPAKVRAFVDFMTKYFKENEL
ncbi:MAG: LysR family transcriptional regulator [Rhizobiales bacterium]|nr:LysR family transcriptional regulator [Hyphomicrobiales bacterium]